MRSHVVAAIALLSACAILGAPPAGAQAPAPGVVRVVKSGATVTVTGSKVADRISLKLSAGGLRVVASGGTRLVATGCKATRAGVVCSFRSVTAAGRKLVATMGRGGDRVVVTGAPDAFESVTLLGGSGDDVLTGGLGDEQIDGGTGDDTLDGGLGADVLRGGADTDSVTYARRRAPVTVVVDAVAGDGGKNEGDRVTAVEHVIGGSGADVLVLPVSGMLSGGPGNDRLEGGSFSGTILAGGSGDDVLHPIFRVAQLPTSTELRGDAGRDTVDLDGWSKTVVDLSAGSGHGALAPLDGVFVLRDGLEAFDMGAGDDDITITGAGAPDLDCGAGTDVARVQPAIKTAGCEHVEPT